MKLVSLNTRGMRDSIKRRKIFSLIREQKTDIAFLQETHATHDVAFMWANQWGNKCIFSHGTSQSRGVALLLSKKLANSVEEIRRDMNGRYIICKIKVDQYSYCIANIYAPNVDAPEFFAEVQSVIQELDAVYNIIGGDFNVVLNPDLDRNVPHSYHTLAHSVLSDCIDELDLCDVWRIKNPESKRFTWIKSRPTVSWSRIDYFLISGNLVQLSKDTTIESCILSDHSFITLHIDYCDSKRGPGYWKFNDKLLDDGIFIDKLKEHVKVVLRLYDKLDAYELWELLKKEIKEFSMAYAHKNNYDKKMYHYNLYKLYGLLQDKLSESTGPTDVNLINNIDKVKIELNEYESRAAQQAAFRCKCNWEERGERSSSYYFNLEKRNYTSKTMYIVRKHDGTLTKDYSEILDVQCSYFRDLYKCDENVNFGLQNTTGAKLNNMQKQVLDEPITKEEMFDAVMTLKSSATPGGNGLTVKLYRALWKDLVQPLYDVHVIAIASRKLNRTARRGIINLIPKRNKDIYEVKSWRPVTVLCNDYKILAKLIANRLQLVAQELIGVQQNGFIPGRSIAFNILKTVEIVSYLNKKHLPGIVVMVDFEKCFDRIAHKSIEGVFNYFGFGDYLINMVMTLFTDFEVCTSNNGFLSDFQVKYRGINQGCNASPLIYTYCGKILNHVVNNNKDIRGIPIDTLKNILSQFADDTGAYLKFEQLTVNAFTEALECVEANMGLHVSYEKTTLYRVGSLCDSDAQLYTKRNFAWSNDSIDTLGVRIKCNGTPDPVNFQGIMTKLNSTFEKWYNRNATLMGKILIVNTLMASLFVYKMTTLYNISETQLKLETIGSETSHGLARSRKSALICYVKRNIRGGWVWWMSLLSKRH